MEERGIQEAFHDLETRLGEVERKYRLLRRWVATMALMATASVLVGAGPLGRVVEAESFVVKDAQGQMRALLTASVGAPVLSLSDAAGKVRTELRVDPNGPKLVLFDGSGNPRAVLEARGPASVPTLLLYDGGKVARLVLGVDEGQPFMSFADPAAKVRNAISAEGISLLDANEVGRVSLVMRNSGGPGLFIGDTSGRTVFKLPPTAVGDFRQVP